VILLVGALRLDMSCLLALVADLLSSGGFLRTVARVVARLATVVALHAIDAFAFSNISISNSRTWRLLTGHMAIAAAGVASLASTATTTTVSASVRVVERGLGAVACNMANLTALKIFST
jgi:hypothetical protein